MEQSEVAGGTSVIDSGIAVFERTRDIPRAVEDMADTGSSEEDEKPKKKRSSQ